MSRAPRWRAIAAAGGITRRTIRAIAEVITTNAERMAFVRALESDSWTPVEFEEVAP